MTNLAAAIGIQQLKKLKNFNKIRNENAKFFTENLKSNKNLITPIYPDDFYHIFHLYTLKVNKRDKLAAYLEDNEIGYGIHYPLPLYKQPLYQELGYSDVKLAAAEKICKNVISIPVHPGLSAKDLKKIVTVINNFFE